MITTVAQESLKRNILVLVTLTSNSKNDLHPPDAEPHFVVVVRLGLCHFQWPFGLQNYKYTIISKFIHILKIKYAGNRVRLFALKKGEQKYTASDSIKGTALLSISKSIPPECIENDT